MELGNNNERLNGVQKNKENEREAAHGVGFGCAEFVLRGVALVLTLTAAIVLALDKQTTIVPLQISPNLPPFNVPVFAKYTYASAYVYLVVANSMACAFAAVSLALAFASKGVRLRLMIIVVDLIMVALLFSSIGASSAVGLIGLKGNSHLQWKKVCNVFGKFCHQVMASVGISLLGAIAFLLLVIISVLKLQKRIEKLN